MTYYYQETDSKVVFALPQKLHSYSVEPIGETTGGTSRALFYQMGESSSLVRSAWSTVRRTENREVARVARGLLTTIREIIESFQASGFDVGYLPALRASNLEDGSVLIEWTFEDFRVGFNVEPDPSDSGWYLITSRNLGEISASGYTSGIETKVLVQWLLSFVISNS